MGANYLPPHWGCTMHILLFRGFQRLCSLGLAVKGGIFERLTTPIAGQCCFVSVLFLRSIQYSIIKLCLWPYLLSLRRRDNRRTRTRSRSPRLPSLPPPTSAAQRQSSAQRSMSPYSKVSHHKPTFTFQSIRKLLRKGKSNFFY